MTRAEVGRRTKRSRALARKLEEVDAADPRAIRATVVRAVREAAEGDYGLFHDMVEVDGRFKVSEVHTDGPCDARAIERTLRMAHDRPLRVFEFRRPPENILSSFNSIRSLFPSREIFEASELFQGMWKPHRTHDVAGLVVYHGQALVGGVSACWGPPREFGPEDREILQPLVCPVREALTAAHCLTRKGLPDETACLIVRPDGRVEHASPRARSWVRRRAIETAIRHRVRDLDRRREPEESSALEQAEARVVRIRTSDGIRYLVCLRPAPLVRRNGAPLLTALQLRIAAAAADGATAGEISRDTGRGVETVRDHIATVYRKLGVATRLELVRALREQDVAPVEPET